MNLLNLVKPASFVRCLLQTFVVVQSLSSVWLFQPYELQYSRLPFIISWSLNKLMSIELVMPSNSDAILCHPLLLLPSIFPSIRVFPWVGSSFRWPKYWSFSFNISPSGGHHSFPWVLVHTGFCLFPKSISWRRQWKLTPVLLPGNSHGQRSLVGCIHGVTKSRTRLRDFIFTFHFHAL